MYTLTGVIGMRDMEYTKLDERYRRFFKSGDSLYPRKRTDSKYEFTKNSIVIRVNITLTGLFCRYMHNDIFIRRDLK